MTTFETPGPVALTVSLACGNVRIVASDRTDTVVEVRPSDESRQSVKQAEQTTVEHIDGRVIVKTPKGITVMWGRTGSVEVDIQVPSGSRLDGDTGLGGLVVDGRLDTCRFKTGMGSLRLGDTGRLDVTTGMGDVAVVHVDGDADVSTGSGDLRLGRVMGTATAKNSNGSISVDELGRNSRLTTSNGSLSVGKVNAGVTAKTAYGSIRVREAKSGDVVLQTAFGELEIGIPEGTAAWLDVETKGTVRNSLTEAGGPGATDEQVKIRARTQWGDITIFRS